MRLCAGLPSAVPCCAGGSDAEAGRAGEEDRAGRGRLQTVLGGAQSGTTGTHTHTYTHSPEEAGVPLRSSDRECEGRLTQGLAARSLKGSVLYLLKGSAVT